MPTVIPTSGFIKALFFGLCIVIGLAGGLAWTLFSESRNLSEARIEQQGSETIAHGDRNPETTIEPQTHSIDPGLKPGIQQAGTDAGKPLNTGTPPTTLPVLSYHDGVMRVAPSVASVYARKIDSLGNPDGSTTSQGSGVIVDSDGIVLTNLHLLQGLDDITVVLSDGRVFAGLLIGSDEETDLAVVRIPATGLPFMKLNEAPPLKVGDVVLAIGNPFGVGQTVTQGIVSATRRQLANGSPWQNFIQIDAAINPGNSGGALINPYGQLVGVNTAVIRADAGAIGIGFSIPADLLAHVVPQIIENGSVARGWLGIDAQDLGMFPSLQARLGHGAVITRVRKHGPASLAGVRGGDIITRFNEQDIFSAAQLLLAVSAIAPGANANLALLRGPDTQIFRESGKSLEFIAHEYNITLGKRPAMPAPQAQ